MTGVDLAHARVRLGLVVVCAAALAQEHPSWRALHPE